MFTDIFTGLTASEVRTLYKKLAHKYHPDKGGNTRDMQKLNKAYMEALKKLYNENLDPEKEDIDWKHEEKLMEKIQKVVNLEGVKIEVLGVWLWVTGNTYPHKKHLRENGFFFSKHKKAWYYRNEAQKGNWRFSAKPLEEIRTKYGSHEVKIKRIPALA